MMNEDNDHEVDDDDEDTVFCCFLLSTDVPIGTWCRDSIYIFTVCSKVGLVSLMPTRVLSHV